MDLLKRNLEAYLDRNNKRLSDFLAEHKINRLEDISLGNFKLFCAENEIDYANMLSRPMFADKSKLKKIKLLILDVDGVMTDAGMFFTESGDQFKKYNAKDGMAIKALERYGVQAGIISSAHKINMVKVRAEMLNIKHIYVGGDPKLKILNEWCKKLEIALDEVAIIGDDINDLAVMSAVGFSACPADAVFTVKETVDLVLHTKGGQACVREFIDFYLLDQPLS